MTFEEYLISKKIDSAAFRAADSAMWEEWKALFDQVSAASFTSQKLYLINPLRRKHKLAPASETQAPKTEGTKPANKPVFKPKIK